jgi:hypothetical protein
MKFSEAFNSTLDHFQINATSISAASGVRAATISEFRRGMREIHTDNLEKLIAALPQDAKQYLFLHALVGEMDDDGLAILLNAVSQRLRQPKPRNQRPDPALSLAS